MSIITDLDKLFLDIEGYKEQLRAKGMWENGVPADIILYRLGKPIVPQIKVKPSRPLTENDKAFHRAISVNNKSRNLQYIQQVEET